MSSARELRALLRLDISAFGHKCFNEVNPGEKFKLNWFHRHLGWELSRVHRGEIRRLIICVPPRSGKSILASVAFPMFALGHDPTQQIICVSHTEELARKFSIDRRLIAQSDWYRKTFPAMTFSGRRQRDLELRTSMQGSCFATGIGGAVLGRGARLIIVDDPIKALHALSKAERRRVAEFYDNTLYTRLNDKATGAIIIIMHRLHEDDLVGHVLGRDDWHVVSIPAIGMADTTYQLSDDPEDVYVRQAGEALHPEREPHSVLEEIRRALGSPRFHSQYQQQPAPAGGTVIHRDWIRNYTAEFERGYFEIVVTSWDTASVVGEANDFSVCTVWGVKGLDYYLLDVIRAKLEPYDLRQRMIDICRHWNTDICLIEDTELGRAIESDLSRRDELRPVVLQARFDKLARLEAQSVRFESGQVHLPEEASWLAEYMSELLSFPLGKHDDQVDSTSQALKWISDRALRAGPMYRRNIERRNFERRNFHTRRE